MAIKKCEKCGSGFSREIFPHGDLYECGSLRRDFFVQSDKCKITCLERRVESMAPVFDAAIKYAGIDLPMPLIDLKRAVSAYNEEITS